MCRQCGMPLGTPADPLRGVSTRPLDLPAQQRTGLGAALGLVAVVIVLGVAGFLVLGGDGLISGGGQLIIGAGSPTPASPVGALGSDDLAPGPASASGPPGTPSGPATAAARTGFTCEGAGISDAAASAWRLTRATPDEQEEWDQVQFALERAGDGDRPTTVDFEWLRPVEAERRYGADRPVGARALVVSFDGTVTGEPTAMVELDQQAIRSFEVVQGDDGRLHAVVGTRGKGCARLVAPAWAKAGADESARVLLDIRRE